MAVQTSKRLRNQVMYSVYVRQFSPEGTFAKVKEALPRIRALGVDIVWLMPIHPVGEKARKGMLGSPYAIRDYRAVNPEFGTLGDFRALTEAIHAQGMNSRGKPRFIAYQKLTKKKQRELNAARRGTWGAMNPVTKRPEPSTAYQREKEKRRWKVEPDHSGVLFFLS